MGVTLAKEMSCQLNLPIMIKSTSRATCISHNCCSTIDYFVCHRKMTLFADHEPTIVHEGLCSPHQAVRLGIKFKDCKVAVEVHKKLKPTDPVLRCGAHQAFEWVKLKSDLLLFADKHGIQEEGGISFSPLKLSVKNLAPSLKHGTKLPGKNWPILLGKVLPLSSA
jgi:hypothetical protein